MQLRLLCDLSPLTVKAKRSRMRSRRRQGGLARRCGPTIILALRYNKAMGPWQPLQFINWPGTYIFMVFAGAVAIHQSRRHGPVLRLIDVLFAVCVAFAIGQLAGFHIGQQADEWIIVAIGGAFVAGVLSILCHAYIPDRGPKPWDN